MSERLRLRGQVWYGTIYVDGRLGECSTGHTDKEAARSVLAGWERDAADPDCAAAYETLNDALVRFLVDCDARVRSEDCVEDTVEAYRRHCGHLVEVLGHEFPLERFKTSRVVSKYLNRRRMQGAKDTTIKKEVQVLKSALKLAQECGVWRGSLDAVVPKSFKPKYKPKKRSLSRADVLALIPHLEHRSY